MAADFIFLDPPYRLEKLYEQTLQLLSQSGCSQPQTVVVAEHEKRFDPATDFSPTSLSHSWSKAMPP